MEQTLSINEILLSVINIVFFEIILSVDNAAVLSTLANKLPTHQQKKALTYGVIGAFLFRFLSFYFIGFILKIKIFKLIGGLYLLYLSYISLKDDEIVETKNIIKIPFLNQFWSVIVGIELMDFIFSIDNIFAISAISKNLYIISFGVFLGIIIMRFASNKFIKIINTYPIVIKMAYILIAILGIKLVLSYWFELFSSHIMDMAFSIIVLIFFLMGLFFNNKNSK